MTPDPKPISHRLWLLSIPLFGLLALAVFSPTLHGKMFSDDYQYLVHSIATNPWWFFGHINPLHTYAYRPVEFATIWVTQALNPDSTLLLHSLQLVVHVGIAVLLAKMLLALRFTKTVAWGAGLYFLLSQSAIHAVGSIDTISQQFETLFGFASLYCLYVWAEKPNQQGPLVLAVAGYAVALFSKELSLSLSVLFALLLGYYALNKRISWVRAACALAPFFLLSVGYIAIRKALHLPTGGFGSGNYDFAVGKNLVINPLLALVQCAMPVSSADISLWTKTHQFLPLGLAAAVAGIVIVAPLAGYVLAKKTQQVLVLAILFFFAIFIAYFMNHISELYIYTVLPIFAVFLLQGLHHLTQAQPRLRMILLCGFGALLISNSLAVHKKASQMVANGEKAAVLMPQIESLLAKAPAQQHIYLVQTTDTPSYSIFAMRGFVVISEGPRVKSILMKRTDLSILVIETAQLAEFRSQANSAFYQLSGDNQIVPLEI